MTTPASEGGGGALWVIGGVIGLALVASQCSQTPATTSNSQVSSDVSVEASNSTAVEISVPVSLDQSAIKRGAAQFRLVAATGIDDAAQIYSQNCFDVLEEVFDWHQLDRCGGFDMVAVRWAESDSDASVGAVTYFGSEAAAGRYLAAATTNGQNPTDADLRFEQLRASAGKQVLPRTSQIVADDDDNLESAAQNANQTKDILAADTPTDPLVPSNAM